MKRKFKLISILTIITTLLFNSIIFADDIIYYEGPLKYKINNNGTVTIVDYYGTDKEVKVPMSMGRFIVTEIAPGAFKDSGVEKVQIPDTIISIDEDAFDNIDSIKINYFDVNDEVVETEINIIYHESNDKNESENNKNQIIDVSTINNEDKKDTVTDIEITEEEIIEEENKETIDEINEQQPSYITTDSNEQDDLNPGEFSSSISLTTGGYLSIVAIVLIILIGIVIIIRKKRNKNR